MHKVEEGQQMVHQISKREEPIQELEVTQQVIKEDQPQIMEQQVVVEL
jgi:hypothetical protein